MIPSRTRVCLLIPLGTVTTRLREQPERKDAEFKDIAYVNNFAKTDEDRAVFDLIFGLQALGRIYVSPPGQPPARTRALRNALIAAMKDEKFLADAAKTQIEIEPMTVPSPGGVAAIVKFLETLTGEYQGKPL